MAISVNSSDGKGFPQWKCCSSEEKGVVAILSQGIPESLTLHSKPHTKLLGKPQKSGCPCSGRKRQRTDWEAAYIGFQGTGVESGDFMLRDRWVFKTQKSVWTFLPYGSHLCDVPAKALAAFCPSSENLG